MKVLSLYGMPDKYIKVISAIYETNIAAVKVGNDVSSWFCSESGFKLSSVLSSFSKNISMNFVLRAQQRL